MDIVVWLPSLGLGKYEAAFRENEIYETVLPNLTADHLKELGVRALSHRRKLLDAIAALRERRNEWQRPTLQVVQNRHERPAGSAYNRHRDSLLPAPVRSVIAIIVAIVIAGVRSRIAVPGRVVVNNGSGLLIRSWW